MKLDLWSHILTNDNGEYFDYLSGWQVSDGIKILGEGLSFSGNSPREITEVINSGSFSTNGVLELAEKFSLDTDIDKTWRDKVEFDNLANYGLGKDNAYYSSAIADTFSSDHSLENSGNVGTLSSSNIFTDADNDDDGNVEITEIDDYQYLGYFQGSLQADSFNYTLGEGDNLAVLSGNGNINYGSGYYDLLNLDQISVDQVSDYSFAEIGSGGTIFNPGNGDRVFDYLTFDNGDKLLFEGIDKIVFSDYEIDLTVTPNDTGYLSQWNLHMMGVQNAWRFTKGSDDVLIGVQDTGLGTNDNGNIHYDLRTTLSYSSNLADDFYREDGDDSYQKNSSHGTSVQGIIGAATDNELGIAGINWNSDVFHIDVLDNNSGDLSLEEATQNMIDQANSQGQRLIINMSLGTSTFDVNYHSALAQLAANNQDNVLFVISAGNNGHQGETGLASPAVLAKDYDNVIAVGASWGAYDENGNTTEPGQRIEYDYWGSQYGSGLTLMGPSEVLTTHASVDGEFRYQSNFNGTSASAPNVTGVASLVWSANPNLSASQVQEILSETAYDLGEEGYDQYYGHGFVNADAAVRRAIALLPSNTDDDADLSGSSVSGEISAQTDLLSSASRKDSLTGSSGSLGTEQFALEEQELIQLGGKDTDYSLVNSSGELGSEQIISFGTASNNETLNYVSPDPSIAVNSEYGKNEHYLYEGINDTAFI